MRLEKIKNNVHVICLSSMGLRLFGPIEFKKATSFFDYSKPSLDK